MRSAVFRRFITTERIRSILFLGAVLALFGFGFVPAAQAQVNVSPSGNAGNSIASPNTSDNIAVAGDGTVYVVWHGSNGIRVARSTDDGQSFGTPTTLTATDAEAEIAVSSDGSVYVAWINTGTLKVARSDDRGQSFNSAVNAGSTSDRSVHLDTDGENVYLVTKAGETIFVSNDQGQSFAARSTGQSSVFSDILVDPETRNVIAQFDDPSVTYTTSADSGSSFGSIVTPSPQPSIFYSSAAISSGSQGRYLFVGGESSMTKINLDTDGSTSLSVPSSSVSQGRSVAADAFGNVVTGYVISAETDSVRFKVSDDLGSSFGPATTVAAASSAQADINKTNGDVLFLYEVNGDVLLKTFSDRLTGYGLTVSRASIGFGEVPDGTSSGTESVTVTNDTGGDVSISSIGTNSPFSATHNCPSTLGDTESCTVDVTFSPSSTGSFTDDLEIASDQPNSPRTVSLAGTGVAALSITDGSASGLDFTAKPNPGTNNNAMGIFELTASEKGASLDSVLVTNDSPGVEGITAARLFWSSDQSLDPGTDTELTSTSVDATGAPSTIGFGGFNHAIQTSARYVFLAVDLESDASVSNVQFSLDQSGHIQTPDGMVATVNGSDQTTFSALPLSSGTTALPVEFASVDATIKSDNAVTLRWETASETNNAGFRIQRRVVSAQGSGTNRLSNADDGAGWTRVGAVSGSGTTDQPQSYRYTDDSVPYDADSLSYRVKQVDTDGTVSFSSPVTVVRGGVSGVQLLGTYPNPAARQTTVRFAVPEGTAGAEPVTLRLYDALGRQVRTVVSDYKEGRHEQTVDVSGLSSGVYVLQLQVGQATHTQKLTVVR